MIGIDEIDKMDPDSAKRFLNDIKAIFGMLDCLYLVSVSDEALQIYEQRILLGRTAFDSAFDEIARVHPLDFESCRHLLRGRIAGFPDSMIAFCEVMSGGVPRDMIRAARASLMPAFEENTRSPISSSTWSPRKSTSSSVQASPILTVPELMPADFRLAPWDATGPDIHLMQCLLP